VGDETDCHPIRLELTGDHVGSTQPSPFVDLVCYSGRVVLSLQCSLVGDRIVRQPPCLAEQIRTGCPAAAGFVVVSVKLSSLVVATFHTALAVVFRPTAIKAMLTALCVSQGGVKAMLTALCVSQDFEL